MSINEKQKSTRMAQDGRSTSPASHGSDEGKNTCPVPELATLFKTMESGTVPNWLDVMAALSGMVAFYTDPDSQSECELDNNFCRSEK